MDQGHGRPLRRLAGAFIVAALALLGALPQGALAEAPPPGATSWGPYLGVTSSTTVAGAHPDLTITAWFCSHTPGKNCTSLPEFNQPAKSLRAQLPSGLVGNPSAIPRCASDTFARMTFTASRCPSESIVGDATVAIVTAVNGGRWLFVGKIYNLKPRGTELARIGVYIDPGEAPNIFPGYAPFRTEVPLALEGGNRVVATAPSVPEQPIAVAPPFAPGPRFKLSDLTMTLKGKAGNPPVPFMQNPTSCAPGLFTVDAGDSSGYVSHVATGYAATACGGVPFTPSLAVTAGSAGQTARNSSPPLEIGVSVPDDQSAITRSQITLPATIRPSVAALNAHSCNAAQSVSGSCSDGTRIGSISIRTPLSDEQFSGPIYLIREPGQLKAKLTAKLGGSVALDLEGSATFNGTRTVATFDDLPDIPLSSLAISLYGGNDGVFTATSDLCGSAQSAASTMVGKTGAISTKQIPISIEGCKPASVSIKPGPVPVHSGYAPVVVSCSAQGASCAGVLSLSADGKSKARAAGKAKALGQASFTVAAGTSRTVGVKLGGAAKRALAKKRSVKALAVAAIKGSGAKQAVVLKAEPAGKKSPAKRKKQRKRH